MIEFKIISTVDRAQISTYQHIGSELTFGKTEGDMLVDDPQLAPLQLRIRIAPGKISLENLDSSVEVRLNGRAIDGSALLKEKDNVAVGKTSIQFLRLDTLPLQPAETTDYRDAASRSTPGAKEQALLDGLEYLEREAEGAPTATKSAVPPPGPKPPPLPGGRVPSMPPPLPRK